MEPDRMDIWSKSGYLTKRGKTFGSWKARFYVVDGPQLKYYDAEGGAQLGSIKLQGAEIGRQSTSSAPNSRYNHALLILEPKRGSSNTRHVLFAESDEERDLWVDILLPWTTYTDSDKIKVADDDRSAVSKSHWQVEYPQSSTFVFRKPGESGRFHPVERIGPYVSIASASIGISSINCRLDLSKTEFGTFGALPGGIIYMDVFITAPQNNLSSVTITATLDDQDPDLQRAIWSASGNVVSFVERPTTVKLLGPAFMRIIRKKDSNIENSVQKPQMISQDFDGTPAHRKTTRTYDFIQSLGTLGAVAP